jgi:hypothetical protein
MFGFDAKSLQYSQFLGKSFIIECLHIYIEA